jgi:hypothetical protein
MADKNPWSDEQLQSTARGPDSTGPWTLTLVAVVILIGLVVGGVLWARASSSPRTEASPTSQTR